MPEPVTAEYFTSRGVDSATAAVYATQRNQMLGRTAQPTASASPSAEPSVTRLPPPVPQPSPTTAPTDAQRAAAEIEAIQRDRMDGKISDHEYRTIYGPKVLKLSGIADSVDAYKRASPGEQAALRAQWDADATQEKLEHMVDAALQPAKAPYEYNLGGESTDPAIDSDVRGAMFSLGLPREMGGTIAKQLNDTAKTLTTASAAKVEQYLAEQDDTVRRMFGASYDAKSQLIGALVREAAERSPALKALLSNHPEVFSHWTVVTSLARFAESRARNSNGRK